MSQTSVNSMDESSIHQQQSGSVYRLFGRPLLAGVQKLRDLATSKLRLRCGSETLRPEREEHESRQGTGRPNTRSEQRRLLSTVSSRDKAHFVQLQTDEELRATLKADGLYLGPTIGEGSFGKIRTVIGHKPPPDRTVDKPVVCKVINKLQARASGVIPSTYVRKFLPRELALIRKIQHPHIVQTHWIYMAPSSVLVFMEYCVMGDLMSHIHDVGPVSQRQAHLFSKQLCDAVEHLHQKGYAHRDIKCENILLENEESVKLTDFGFARKWADEHGQRVKSETYCGTMIYSAPEMIEKSPYYPEISDVWALGVVLYRMLADCFPFPPKHRVRFVADQIARNLKTPKRYITYDAQTLFSIIFEPDVKKRATIKQIKQHPWITKEFKD